MAEPYALCEKGHELSPDNTYRTGLRDDNCLTCKRDNTAARNYIRMLITPERLRQLRLNTEWKYLALCRQYPEIDMFPSTGQPIKAQRNLCAQCPVRVECFTVGLFEPHGIWGGYSVTEREDMRRGKRAIPSTLFRRIHIGTDRGTETA